MKEWKRYIQKCNDNLKDGKYLDEGNKRPQDEQDTTGNDIDEEDGMSVNSSSSESVEDPKRVAARELLVNYIDSNNSRHTKATLSKFDEWYDSGDTAVAGFSRVKSKKPVKKTSLTNFMKVQVEHVGFCKVKIMVKKSESPTSTMVKTFAALVNILHEIDKSIKLLKYKDRSNRSFISRLDQIPNTPSRIKDFSWKLQTKIKCTSDLAWIKKIGLNMDAENFIEDIKCLLDDKNLSFLFKNIFKEKKRKTLFFSYSQTDFKTQKD